MSGRDLVVVGALGTAAWLVFRRLATTLPADALQGPSSLSWPADGLFPALDFTFPWPGGDQAPDDSSDQASPASSSSYDASTITRESGGKLLAKNPLSSASGKYQFTKATWQKLGGAWGSDPSKAFGGLAPSEAEQDMRYNMLTSSNAAGLARAGLAVSNAYLYAVHFLGLPTALKVLTAPASASLAALVGSKVINENPKLKGFTVADFKSWIGAQG